MYSHSEYLTENRSRKCCIPIVSKVVRVPGETPIDCDNYLPPSGPCDFYHAIGNSKMFPHSDCTRDILV